MNVRELYNSYNETIKITHQERNGIIFMKTATYVSDWFDLKNDVEKERYMFVYRSLDRMKLKDVITIHSTSEHLARFENVVISDRKNNWRKGFLEDWGFKRAM